MTNPPLFPRQGVPPAHLGTRIHSAVQQALDDHDSLDAAGKVVVVRLLDDTVQPAWEAGR